MGDRVRAWSCLLKDSTDSGPDMVEPSNFKLSFAAVVVCGAMNNFPYCVMIGASQDLARQFHVPHQTPVMSTCMMLGSLLATFINMKWLIGIEYKKRLLMVLLMTAGSYLGVSLAVTNAFPDGWFWSCCFAAVLTLAQIFGELGILAFLRSFPPELVGGWGTGTGVAGILSSFMYILLRGPLNLSSSLVFVLCLPSLVIFWLSFEYLRWETTNSLSGPKLEFALGGGRNLLDQTDPKAVVDSKVGPGAAVASVENVKAALHVSGDIVANLVGP